MFVARPVNGLLVVRVTAAIVVQRGSILEAVLVVVRDVRPVIGLPAAKRTDATAVLPANIPPLAVQVAVRIVQLGNTKA